MNQDARIATLFDLARMCDTMDCSECKLNPCLTTMRCHPERANDIVNDWCNEHPIKTYADDFFEKFPKAKRCQEGYPALCRNTPYGICEDSCGDRSCAKCWNEPMEEENNDKHKDKKCLSQRK